MPAPLPLDAQPIAPPPRASNAEKAMNMRRVDGERAQVLLESSASGWIGPADPSSDSYSGAVSRARRLVACLQEIEGEGSRFERRVWQVGMMFCWAIRRKKDGVLEP